MHKYYGIAGALLILAVPYVLTFSTEIGHIENEQSLCPFKMITGFPCPGCGITKSMIFFYDGNIAKSFYYHLFGPFTVLFCVFSIIILTAELLTRKEYFRKILFNKNLSYFLGASLVIYHITRLVFFISSNNIDSILEQSIWK